MKLAKDVLRLLKEAAGSWSEDYAPSMGAALSYYSLFSIAPLLLIVIAVAGFVFGADAARGAIFGELRDLMGDQGAQAVAGLLQAADKPAQGILSAVVGVVVLLLGAMTVFGELQNALDRIWRAPARVKASGLWSLVHQRILSFGMILGIAFLLMVSLVVSAALAALGKWWGAAFTGWEIVAHAVDILVSFGLMTVMFALIYRYIPRVHVHWHDVWIGAAVTSLLFAVGKFAIGLYLGKSSVASSFGAAGSLVVLMVWVYYSAQIFLFGAEFTWVYAHEFGSRRGVPRPRPSAAQGEPAGETEPARQQALSPPALRPVPLRHSPPPAAPARRHPVGRLGVALIAGAALGIANTLAGRQLYSKLKRRFA